MSAPAKTKVILMAEDDSDDRLLAQDALSEAGVEGVLQFVLDGEELLDYLGHRGKYSSPKLAPRPALILLDLNMPKRDGREVLREIKSDPDLRTIPVVVLTTSKADTDIEKVYALGASSFIAKPVKFDALVNVMRLVGDYWFGVVELPAAKPVAA
jgi:CheY-like chemotaxis protein